MLSFDAACDVAAAVLNSEFATNLQGQANIKILANLLYDETARQQGVRHGPMILQSCTPALTRHMIVVLLQTLDSLDCNVENTIFVVPNQQVAQEWRMILRKISAFGARKRASGDAPRVQIQTHKGACDQLLRWKGLNLRLIIDLMSLERQSREARMVKQLQTLTGINRMYFLTPVISLMTRHRTLLMDHIMHVHGQSHMSASHVSPETRFHYYHCTIPCTSKCIPRVAPSREQFPDPNCYRRALEDWQTTRQSFTALDEQVQRLVCNPRVLFHAIQMDIVGSGAHVSFIDESTNTVYGLLLRGILRRIKLSPVDSSGLILGLLQWCAGDRVTAAKNIMCMHFVTDTVSVDSAIADFVPVGDLNAHWGDTLTALRRWGNGQVGGDCTICWDTQLDAITVLSCGHHICVHCFLRRIYEDGQCPLCRCPFEQQPCLDMTKGYRVLMRNKKSMPEPLTLSHPRITAIQQCVVHACMHAKRQQVVVMVGSEELSKIYRSILRHLRVRVVYWQDLYGRDLTGIQNVISIGPLTVTSIVYRQMLANQGLNCDITYITQSDTIESPDGVPTELLPYMC